MMDNKKAHIQWHGVNIMNIIKEVKITRDEEYNTSSYIGTTGSTTNHISSTGRIISFKSLCTRDEPSRHGRPHRINDYIALAVKYKGLVKVLTSPSMSNLNGNYMMSGFEYSEDTGGNYEIEWEFTEVVPFNVTEKTFRVWGKAVSSTSKAKKTTTKTSTSKTNLSSNIKYLLKTCGTMKKGSSSKKCVKSLQKFLQSKGYYKGYKVDGVYAIYTEKAVKSLQKANKLKTTGQWDKATRTYWQKKYKYP